MRNTLLIIIIAIVIVSCGKDKYTTAPQIKYKSVNPNVLRSNIPNGQQEVPQLTIQVTDKEGDLGWITGKDSAYVIIKSLINNQVDTFQMPDISSIVSKNYEADLLITPKFYRSNRPSPKIDTLYYEIYVTDFAKNKSNVITTGDPVYYIIP